MDSRFWIELFGYFGSSLVVISMLMTSVTKLRRINTAGSVLFAIYALIIHSYPTVLMNLILAGINIYHLVRLRNTKKHYDLVRADMQDGYLQYLLNQYESDIESWFPGFSLPADPPDVSFLLCCDGSPAGLFLGRDAGDGVLEIILDYATPVYRDTSVGQFLYEQLKKLGYRKLIFRGEAPRHVPYLTKVGFVPGKENEYIKTL